MRSAHRILLLIWLLTAALGVVAQEPGNEAPVVIRPSGNTAPILWEHYQLPDEKLSVMLPKLPVQSSLGDSCEQTRGSAFHVYADNAVYELRFYAKLRGKTPAACGAKVAFSEDTLVRRLAYLQQTEPAPTLLSDTSIGVRKAKVFTWDTKTEIAKRWIIADFPNDRWVELSINYRKNAAVDEARFLNSLQLGNPTGKAIGAGSGVTVGDIESPPSVQGKPVDGPRVLINKTPALYTDAARSSNTQGTVKLKLVFLSNGSIGNVTVLSPLPHGLTEQAIAAARRIVFIPKRVAGVPISVAQEIHYDFRLY